ncbi:SDR family oxidoreductase [uncultured Clostridium sp.]|uniref:SDR family oxidoreductase n=1 Tax=uncultured Clostridium sp. TaxID=59620 RepID=UPI0026159A43|nr:SDR family oxidoreductase [uncultured Clostridium sp.]
MNKNHTFPTQFPKQHQDRQPGLEKDMNPLPISEHPSYINDGKRLKDKIAIITGGDSGIGKAISLAYVNEGAKVVIVYFDEHDDAKETERLIKEKGGDCLLISGDLGDPNFCQTVVDKTIEKYSKIDILINNAAMQFVCENIEDLSDDQFLNTFKSNMFSAFYLTKRSLKYMECGSCIINTTSIVSYRGNEKLIDYSCTKGALTTFTRSLAKALAPRGIRVNAVAPGPIWTPLIPSSFNEEDSSKFGQSTAFKRAGQPVEVAESYVFLASNGASYITGEAIHVNGGEVLNS